MPEHWKPIDKHPLCSGPFYEVSNLGRVRNINTGKVLKNRACGRKREQYATVLLYGKNMAVHRLVAHHFLGPRPDGQQVNHIDSNKMNPCVTNLEYVTPHGNVQHGYDSGSHKPLCGERNPSVKLTASQVAEIRALYVPWKVSQPHLARKYGVTQATIWHIVSGESWKEVR
jgi:hypothetical protein